MSYFPLFASMDGRIVTIIGGGKTAFQKVLRLLDFNADIRVYAREFLRDFHALPGVKTMTGEYQPEIIEGSFLVIAATNDKELNSRIFQDCSRLGILCNCVDDPKHSSVIFPAIVKDGDLVIGISTEGASPSAAVYLKHQIESMIPEHFDQLLDWLQSIRPMILETIPRESDRTAIFHAAFSESLAAGKPLSNEELEALIKRITSSQDNRSILADHA